MRIREVVGYALAVAGCSVAIVFGMRYSQDEEQIEQLEKQLTTAKNEAIEEQQRVTRLEKEIAAERAKADALRREARQNVASSDPAPKAVMPTTPAVSGPIGEKPAPSSPKKTNGMKKMMEMGMKMAKEPAFKEKMRLMMRPIVAEKYREFFEEAGLPDDVRKAVTEEMLNRNDAMQEIGTLLMDENVADEEIVRRQEEAFAKSREGLAALLTPDQIARLENFEKDLPEKARVKAAEKEIEPFGLEPWRREQVRAIILEEEKAADRENTGFNPQRAPGERLTEEDIRRTRAMFQGETEGFSKTIASMKETNTRLFARIQPILTPDQFESFKKTRESQVSILDNSLQMIKMMGDSSEAKEEPKKE